MNQVILYQIDFQNVTIVDKYLNRTIPFNLVMEKNTIHPCCEGITPFHSDKGNWD